MKNEKQKKGVKMGSAKFGSVKWQSEMSEKILAKMMNGEDLEGYEQAFLEIQGVKVDADQALEIMVQKAKKEKKKDEPEYGKQYALTGKSGDKCIMNGNTWAESEVKESD